MSLLEDVFLEDEAGEAQELERIIEGDEYDERPMPDSDGNSEKEDEAEEDKRRVDPTSAKPKRVVKNPRVILNPARLTGPRGIQIIPEHFKDFIFKGKGHERDDLDLVLKKLEHWAYRLYPKFEFKDCLKKMETLGNKRPVMVHLTKIRTDQFMSEDTVVQRDSSDDETPAVPQAPEEDEFDRLLQQQIELARTTPGPGSAKRGPPGLATPMVDKSLMMPKASSSPLISEEQKQRMLRNRQLAEERRLARLNLNNSGNNTSAFENSTKYNRSEEKSANNNESANNISLDKDTPNTNIGMKPTDDKTENSSTIIENAEETIAKAKTNRSNVIDSSDDDEDSLVIHEAVTVDVHTSRNDDDDEHNKNYRATSSDKNQDNENVKELNKINVVSNEELSNTAINETEITGNDLQCNVKDSHDIEMNEIKTVKGSNSEQSNSHIISDNTDSVITLNDHQNEVNVETQDCKEAEPTIVDKQVSGKASLSDVSSGNTETNNKVEKEIDEVAMEDIMDVDFSEDF